MKTRWIRCFLPLTALVLAGCSPAAVDPAGYAEGEYVRLACPLPARLKLNVKRGAR